MFEGLIMQAVSILGVFIVDLLLHLNEEEVEGLKSGWFYLLLTLCLLTGRLASPRLSPLSPSLSSRLPAFLLLSFPPAFLPPRGLTFSVLGRIFITSFAGN